MSGQPIVIVGAGHAGCQLAFSLREGGFDGRIVLLDGEGVPPYQRPPLSKAFLSGAIDEQALQFKSADYWARHGIERVEASAVAIDRPALTVQLSTGQSLGYGHLVLAMGGLNRELPVPGRELDGVHVLRTLADAKRLRPALASARQVAVVGAGFIGLEFAAVAAKAGLPVTVFEALDRPLARAASPALSAFVHQAHEGWGVRWQLGSGVREIRGASGRVAGVVDAQGTEHAADLLVYGIGVRPNAGLAQDAGLAVEDGIVVDEQLLSSDPAISAIGDIAAFPCGFAGGCARGRRMRIESVQNALDQARCVAARLLGRGQPYRAWPWFWSDQGDRKLQIVGLPSLCDQHVVVSSVPPPQAIVLGFAGGRLAAVETVNRPADHLLARKLLAQGRELDVATASAPGFDFKAWGITAA